ncbi:cbb3-type cytochrome c oxidase subunit I [Rhizobium sp. L1K21]|uniref:cbb3-type cytochrome c oxidase subunit I n=1 Tax=Rhizobium sp. L1K21 TaxID=2954933 RepID=UPI002093E661|nr:cbb3-type cytochrome c oxidase subunit I [Rhizobium sp. L1K21]
MRGIAFLFFVSAVIYVLAGMILGIEMSASQDHSFAPVHAHLNLIGWVTMGMFGIYYHLVPEAGESGLAKVHFAIATIGLWLIVPGIALAIREVTEVLAIAGSFLTVLSLALFLFIVFKTRKPAIA